MRGHNPCIFTKFGMCVVKIMHADFSFMLVFLLALSAFFLSCLRFGFVIE